MVFSPMRDLVISVAVSVALFISGVSVVLTYDAVAWTHGHVETYSPEATQFFARITDPGTAQKVRLATLIDGRVASGYWAVADAWWVTAADIAGNAVFNLKSSSYTLIPNGSPTFTAYRGFTGGTGKFLNTQFNPFTAVGVNMVQNSAHMCVRTNLNISELTYAMGNNNAVPSTLALITNNAGKFGPYIFDGAGDTTPVDVPAGNGVFLGNRSGATATQAYYNGSPVGTDSHLSGIPHDLEIYLMAKSGSSPLPASNVFSMGCLGGSVSDSIAADLAAGIETYMAAVP